MTQLIKRDNAATQSQVVELPGREPAMLDRDVARIYGVETRALNQAVRRNKERFPEPVMRFRATKEERSQIVTSIERQGQSVHPNQFLKLPYLYTQPGAHAAAFVLNSDEAIRQSHQIVQIYTDYQRGKLPQQQLVDPYRLAGLEQRQDALEARQEALEADVYGEDAINRRAMALVEPLLQAVIPRLQSAALPPAPVSPRVTTRAPRPSTTPRADNACEKSWEALQVLMQSEPGRFPLVSDLPRRSDYGYIIKGSEGEPDTLCTTEKRIKAMGICGRFGLGPRLWVNWCEGQGFTERTPKKSTLANGQRDRWVLFEIQPIS